MLLIDEAEGLLPGRGMAVRSWELTQVNEFLRRIEEFEGMLVVATNLVDALDEAFLRRFQFKVEFLPMRTEQRVAFFKTAVHTEVFPAGIEGRFGRLGQLTLGDFANVHRQFALIGAQPTPEQYLEALESEHAAKPRMRASGMGFLCNKGKASCHARGGGHPICGALKLDSRFLGNDSQGHFGFPIPRE